MQKKKDFAAFYLKIKGYGISALKDVEYTRNTSPQLRGVDDDDDTEKHLPSPAYPHPFFAGPVHMPGELLIR